MTRPRRLIPAGLVNPNHGHFGPIPAQVTLYTAKVSAQLNNAHSMMARYAGQRDDRDAVTFTTSNDNREPENSSIRMWSVVGQHNWVLGNRGLNQITGQVNHLYRLSDVTSAITANTTRVTSRAYLCSRPVCHSRPSTPAPRGGGSITDTYVIQIKMSVDADRQPRVEIRRQISTCCQTWSAHANEHFPTLTFFDDPSVILSNSNGRYPQGFQTPGIVRQWQQANPVRAEDIQYGAKQFMTWFQDDGDLPRLTLNLGCATASTSISTTRGTTRTTQRDWCSRQSEVPIAGCRKPPPKTSRPASALRGTWRVTDSGSCVAATVCISTSSIRAEPAMCRRRTSDRSTRSRP